MNKITNQSQSRIKKSSLEDHVNPSFQRSGGLSASGKRSGPTPFIDNNPSTISSKVVR